MARTRKQEAKTNVKTTRQNAVHREQSLALKPVRPVQPQQKRSCPCYPIFYSSIGTACDANRPLSKLPPHIFEILNDHYVQLSRGLMVHEADLYNNGDHPTEFLYPSVMNQQWFNKLMQEIEEEKVLSAQSTSRATPKSISCSSHHLIHGETIGIFVIFGTGQITRAVCSKTREVFTAHVLPEWKAKQVIDVIKRLQIADDMTAKSADEIRLSELCVSKRLEIIRSNNRYIIFNPCETNTIHSYATERLDKITENEAMDIYRKVVEIVTFCHSRKVLVRNFKTRNFYLKKDENDKWIVRVCFLQDMICEEDISDTQNTRRSVCVPFMAPEMLTAEAKTVHSHTTEMWALGVLLYILLTGKYPFHGTNMPLLFRNIRFKQHRWPINYITDKSKKIANRLLTKIPSLRMNLETLWKEIQGDYPNIRCRSNLLLKQQDLIIKMDMLDMYYNSYKDRLLPQNVQPMFDELKSLRHELKLATEKAKEDLKPIEDAIKEQVQNNPTTFQTTVKEIRLQQINSVLNAGEIELAQKENRQPRLATLKESDISLELLLPGAIYPISDDYHPSHKPVDRLVYNCLREANALAFPSIMMGGSLHAYPPPVFLGEVVSS